MFLKGAGVKTNSSLLSSQMGKEHGEKVAELQFTNDTTFTLGGLKFETFFPGNGNAPGNIVVWFPKPGYYLENVL